MDKKISQREKDFTYISELCKYSEIYVKNSTCPLILKRCNNENCPLFFLREYSRLRRCSGYCCG